MASGMTDEWELSLVRAVWVGMQGHVQMDVTDERELSLVRVVWAGMQGDVQMDVTSAELSGVALH